MDHAADFEPIRYVAIGDSLSEGVGDERADGSVRGWTDLVAQRWADVLDTPLQYANLAIRGRKIEPIVHDQLEVALALEPTHLSLNGGGNDILRPRADLEYILGLVERAVERCSEAGVELILLSGGNPCSRLPLGRRFERRGDYYSHQLEERFSGRPGVTFVHNWFDETLTDERFWSGDRLHMNARGHHRVAARVLQHLGADAPDAWWDLEKIDAGLPALRGAAYYRTHIGPWIKRRVTGTSSGDGRDPKHADWVELAPAHAHAQA